MGYAPLSLSCGRGACAAAKTVYSDDVRAAALRCRCDCRNILDAALNNTGFLNSVASSESRQLPQVLKE
jgi:hypothetical protein